MRTMFISMVVALCEMMTASAQIVSIEQCYKWAEENYPLTKRYDLISQTEGFTVENIKKGWLPQIEASLQGSYQSTVTELPDGLLNLMKQMGSDVKGISHAQYRAAIDVQQTVYDGGAISAKKKLAERESKVKQASADVQMYQLHERVNNLFFGNLLLDKQLELNEEKQRAITSNLDRLEKMLKGGTAMQCDVDALNAELLLAKQQHTDIEAQRETFLKVLSLLTGHEIKGFLLMPALVNGNLNSESFQLRPEMRLFDSQLSLIDAKERMLDVSVLPKVGLFAQGYYGYVGMNMFRDMMKRTPTLNGIVGVKAMWNISAFYTHKHDRSKLALDRQTVENDRDIFLFNQHLQFQQEDRNISRYQKLINEDANICQLRHNVRVAAEEKLKAGIVDVNTLIEEISNENRANINRAIHEIELKQHQYKSKTIKGE